MSGVVPPLNLEDQLPNEAENETLRCPLAVTGRSIISDRPDPPEIKMSTNKRYGIDRRNVNNRTFTNNTRGHYNEPPTPRVDARKPRQNPSSKRHEKETRFKDKPQSSESRYQAVPEMDEDDGERFEDTENRHDSDPDDYKTYRKRYDDVSDRFEDRDGRYEEPADLHDKNIADEDRYEVRDEDDENKENGRKFGKDDEEKTEEKGDDWADDNDNSPPTTYSTDKLFLSEQEMLDQSTAELQATIAELEKRFDCIEDEGSEWKTRFETQQEMNQQMERQMLLLQTKVEDARRNLREVNKTPRDGRRFDHLEDASPQMIKNLEREKGLLANQLRDLEWRLDQESKAYHKANDERKQYILEVNSLKGNISETKARQQMLAPPGHATGTTPRSHRDTTGNIPNHHRVIDPKKGPIRKTAGVKNLPSLDSN